MKQLLSILLLISSLSLVHGQNLPWIKFYWTGDSIGDRYFDKLTMDVPIKIDNIPFQLKAQLDLGAENTMLYGNSFQPYLEFEKALKNKIDSSTLIWIQGQKNPTLKGVNLKLDNILFSNIDIVLFNGFGDTLTLDSIHTNTIKHVGTIAPDLFQNKILVIDYPNKRLCVLDELPKRFLKGMSFVDFKIRKGRIKIPFQINNKEQDLLFDTGASLFPLFTTIHNINDVSDENQAIADSLLISTWGEYYYIFGKETITEVKLGNRVLPPTKAYFTNRNDMINFFKEEEIWGSTGNAYFLNNVVVIDYKNKRFGVK